MYHDISTIGEEQVNTEKYYMYVYMNTNISRKAVNHWSVELPVTVGKEFQLTKNKKEQPVECGTKCTQNG